MDSKTDIYSDYVIVNAWELLARKYGNELIGERILLKNLMQEAIDKTIKEMDDFIICKKKQ